MTFILTFASLYPRVLFGFLITRLIWKTTERKYLFIQLFLSSAIGFGVSSLLSFLWIWLGFSLTTYAKIEIFLSALISLSLIVYNKNLTIRMIITSIGEIKEKIWFALFLLVACIFTVTLALKGLESPHGGFDAWYNWNVVSRFIYRGGDEWQNTFLRVHANTDYPLFIPLVNALTWVYVQKDTIFAPIIFNLILSLFATGLLFSFINFLKGFKQAVLAFIFFIGQSFSTSAMGQIADFPFSYVVLAIGGLTLLYFETRANQLAILAGLVTGLAPWVKNEGFVIVISSTLIWVYVYWFHDRNTLKSYLLGLVFPLSIVISFKIFLAPPNAITSSWQTMLEKIIDIERYIFISQKFALELWSMAINNIIPIALIIGYILTVGKAQKRHKLILIGFMIAFQLSAYFVIYLVTPYDLEWHLRTSLSRLYFHVYPLFFLIIFIWLKSPDEIITSETNTHALNH